MGSAGIDYLCGGADSGTYDVMCTKNDFTARLVDEGEIECFDDDDCTRGYSQYCTDAFACENTEPVAGTPCHGTDGDETRYTCMDTMDPAYPESASGFVQPYLSCQYDRSEGRYMWSWDWCGGQCYTSHYTDGQSSTDFDKVCIDELELAGYAPEVEYSSFWEFLFGKA